jgi:hypothetical protein
MEVRCIKDSISGYVVGGWYGLYLKDDGRVVIKLSADVTGYWPVTASNAPEYFDLDNPRWPEAATPKLEAGMEVRCIKSAGHYDAYFQKDAFYPVYQQHDEALAIQHESGQPWVLDGDTGDAEHFDLDNPRWPTAAAPKTEFNNVTKPAHYADTKIEVIDYIEDKGFGYHLGNAVKYISRAGKKDPAKTIEDLEKAIWYIERKIAKLKNAK